MPLHSDQKAESERVPNYVKSLLDTKHMFTSTEAVHYHDEDV